MGLNGLDEYWVPEHVKDYLRKRGFALPLDDMEPWIRSRDDWMSTRGDFYNYRDKDGVRRVYELHWRGLCRRATRGALKDWGHRVAEHHRRTSSIDAKRQERARCKAHEALLSLLESEGVRGWSLRGASPPTTRGTQLTSGHWYPNPPWLLIEEV